jgi:lipid A 3-O-deacylase
MTLARGRGIDMKRTGVLAAAGGVVMLGLGPAQAGPLSDVYVGVVAHNIQVIDPKNAGKEQGPNIELGVRFTSPGFLSAIGKPRPYAMVSANTAGDTSFAALGLAWRVPLGPDWSFDPALGIAWHDAARSNPFPNGDPRATAFSERRIINSSRDVFHTSLGVSRGLGERARLGFVYEHLSHGQILGSGRNQGIDQAALRLSFNLD